MFTKSNLMFLYAETSLHLGSGTRLTAIDLPIQRERYTNFPLAAGSGIKGAARELLESFEEKDDSGKLKIEGEKKIFTIFGPEDTTDGFAGAVSFSDGRILLFPVKSVRGIFAYITCPAVLNKLKRDLSIIGGGDFFCDGFSPNNDEAFGTSADTSNSTEECDLIINGNVILEEFSFKYKNNPQTNKTAKWLSENALPEGGEYKYWKEKVRRSLIILSDDNFKDFVEFSTEVNARIKLGEGKSSDTKKGGNLFYEENLPCETVLYSLFFTANPHSTDTPDSLKTDEMIMKEVLNKMNNKRMQIGGDETIGKGIVKIKFLRNGG